MLISSLHLDLTRPWPLLNESNTVVEHNECCDPGGQQETDNGTADIKAQREAELAQDKVASSESEDYDSEASLSDGAVQDGHKPEAIVPVGRKQDDIEMESDED